MQFDYEAQPLTDVKERRGFVLGTFMGSLWIGVRFGDMWRPARRARYGETKFFD